MKLPVPFLFVAFAFGQTTTVPAVPSLPNITLPTYIAAGAAFNQLGTPRTTLFLLAAVPVSSQKGVYESTAADLIPIAKIDPATGRTVYTFQAQFREGLHKTLYTGSKVQIMLGGDVGGSFSTTTTTTALGTISNTSGISVNLATSVTATFVYQISAHWAFMVPVRGVYMPSIGGINWIPEAGIVWKP